MYTLIGIIFDFVLIFCAMLLNCSIGSLIVLTEYFNAGWGLEESEGSVNKACVHVFMVP